jgi:hypothetical protein
MKVPKIEGVLLHLSSILGRKLVGAYLALHDHDGVAGNDNQVYPTAKAIKRVLEEYGPVTCLWATGHQTSHL